MRAIPTGRIRQHWEEARSALEREYGVQTGSKPIETKRGASRAGEMGRLVDEAGEESLPASDPPSFTASGGPRNR